MHTSFKVDEKIQKRIELVTDDTETVSQFAKKALIERLRRMEARDDRCINQSDDKLVKMIRVVLLNMKERGEL